MTVRREDGHPATLGTSRSLTSNPAAQTHCGGATVGSCACLLSTSPAGSIPASAAYSTRVWCSGSTSVFQTGSGGSIPPTRTGFWCSGRTTGSEPVRRRSIRREPVCCGGNLMRRSVKVRTTRFERVRARSIRAAAASSIGEGDCPVGRGHCLENSCPQGSGVRFPQSPLSVPWLSGKSSCLTSRESVVRVHPGLLRKGGRGRMKDEGRLLASFPSPFHSQPSRRA